MVDEVCKLQSRADREQVLGFKPQRENPYNRLLPYAAQLDEESNKQLAEIKAHLALVIQLCDIKVGATHWVGQLTKYAPIICFVIIRFRFFGFI